MEAENLTAPSLIDRITAATYEGDELVAFGIGERDFTPWNFTDDSWSYVPKPLFFRLLFLGMAYDLSNIATIQAHADTLLNSKQCRGLAKELKFLSTIIRDDALTPVLQEILRLIAKVEQNSGMKLAVCLP